MMIVFSLPPTLFLYSQNPELFVLDLINRSHPGSAQDQLFNLGLIRSFSGELIEELSDQTLIQITV